MFEKLGERFLRLREVFAALSPGRKILVLGGLAAVVAAFVVLLLWTNRARYNVLYSGLPQEDAAAIVEKLTERKIPYKLSKDAKIIEIPEEVIQDTRLFLATMGLPTGGSVGMEMFDEQKLGETDFLQHLKLQRALQGELERTIKRFEAVNQVRVHLNIPKESLFIEEKRPPTASVILSLKRGQSLSRNQLSGIVHLVASSVEGLSPDNISVVDTAGGLLYSKDGQDPGVLTATQIEAKQKMERDLSNKITAMLERVVGPNKAFSRVSADLNFDQMSTNEEIYDPDRSVVRSEQRLKETNQGPPRGASGVPQSSFELGTGNEASGEQGRQGEIYQRSEDTTNYEITKISRQIITPAGGVKRLSVAVMVDGVYDKDGVYTPRPANELETLTTLVKNAVGFDETRGDTVEVRSMSFFLPTEEPLTWSGHLMNLLRQYGRMLINIMLIVLFFLFVVRPLVGWFIRETAPTPEPELAALPVGEEFEALPDYKKEPSLVTREQVLQVAQQNPERTLNLLRAWIEEESA